MRRGLALWNQVGGELRASKGASRTAALDELAQAAIAGGGPKRIERQHGRGKLTARERLGLLMDRGEYTELDQLVVGSRRGDAVPGDGVVTVRGKVYGRDIMAFSQDFTVHGGTLSEANASKICKVMDRARESGCPVVGMNDSGGARIQEGVASLAGYTEVFKRNVQLSGAVPQISLILGPCAGGAVYSPALTDFTIMAKGTSHMFVTGPDVIKEVLHETVDMEQLGGAQAHTTKSGVAHFSCETEIEAIASTRRLLSYLPGHWTRAAPPSDLHASHNQDEEDEFLDRVVPVDANQPYDMAEVIERIVDRGELLQTHEAWARNVITGFARLGGHTVGVVANQPKELAGVLDINASIKAARFVRFCDAFNIPLATFVDVPGFLPGSDQEWNGIIRHGAKLLYAYAEATTPKVTVITRKAYGGAYCVMSSKHLRGDYNYAWPSAEVAVMGAKGAAKILYGKNDIDLTAKEAEYEREYCNPFEAARRGYLDGVIHPRTTRGALIRDLAALRSKAATQLVNPDPAKKHGNIPL